MAEYVQILVSVTILLVVGFTLYAIFKKSSNTIKEIANSPVEETPSVEVVTVEVVEEEASLPFPPRAEVDTKKRKAPAKKKAAKKSVKKKGDI